MNSTFQGMTGYFTQDVSETSGDIPEKLTQGLVAPRFFSVWGIPPALGRGFVLDDYLAGRNVVVLSDRLWRRRFAANPNAIGRTLRVEGFTFSIVGVMPASFLFPDRTVDFWSPVLLNPQINQFREATWYTVIGRLKPGVTLAQARADLATVQSQLGKAYPKTDAALAVRIEPLKQLTVGGVGRSLWILFGAVSVLLLIACTNIAALLLARTADRQREIAIRYSLGAARLSIVAQLLTEVLVLALAGSAVALALAGGASTAFRALAKDLPRVDEIVLNGRLLAYTVICAVLTTLLCGLYPALRATRRNLAGSLAQGSRTQVSGRNPVQWLLVGVQVALAVTLLIGAGLLLRSFQALGRVSPGFDADHVLTFRISANWGETGNLNRMQQRVDRELDTLRHVPGVEAAATSLALPGLLWGLPGEFRIVEGAADPNRKIIAMPRLVSAGYFETMRIPVLAGAACSVDRSGGVVVNRRFADVYFAGRTFLGNHLATVPANPYSPPAEIRGIVADAREEGLQREPEPTVYTCYSAPVPSPAIVVRTHGEPMAIAETIRRKIHELEPARSVYDVSPLEEHLHDALGEHRMRTILLTFFALTAVSLACVGLYGTLSYVVSLRRREVGLRLAIGALPGQIVNSFLWEGLRASLLGCAAGLALAALFTRLLSGMLYGVTALDAATFCAVALLMLLTGIVSALVPAAKAARVEPMQVLREE
jgi:putative ABC transport system permease protein